MNKLELVKEWRRTFGLPVSEVPVVLSPEIVSHHAGMISDEADEILKAIKDGVVDLIQIRDVAGDLLYFVLGVYAEAGLDWDDVVESSVISSAYSCAQVLAFVSGKHPLEHIHATIKQACGELHEHIPGVIRVLAVRSVELLHAIKAIDHLDSDFIKIHAANMAKLWTTEQVVFCFMHRTIKSRGEQVTYTDKFGKWTADSAGDDQWVVRLNGKVQKPPGWRAAVLEGGVV